MYQQCALASADGGPLHAARMGSELGRPERLSSNSIFLGRRPSYIHCVINMIEALVMCEGYGFVSASPSDGSKALG